MIADTKEHHYRGHSCSTYAIFCKKMTPLPPDTHTYVL